MSIQALAEMFRGPWLIHQGYVEQHLPMIISFLKGDVKLDFNAEKPVILSYHANVSNNNGKEVASKIAVVRIKGPIPKFGGWSFYGATDYAQMIKAAAGDETITGILLDIDSPGGHFYGNQTLTDSILQAKVLKPVVAFVNDGYACSAAY